MKKQVLLDGKAVDMEISADTPRQFREEFNQDVLVGLSKIKKKFDIGLIEKLAYVMAKACNGQIEPFTEWLRGFDNPMTFYNASADIITMWLGNTATSSKAQKK